MSTYSKAKPFIKWVGGKGQLIEQLDAQLPVDFETWDDVTYIEPFVGGGAVEPCSSTCCSVIQTSVMQSSTM